MFYYEIHFDYTELSDKDSDGYSKFFKSTKDVEDDTEYITNLAIEEGILDEDDLADLEYVDYAQKIDEDEYFDATGEYKDLTEANDENDEVIDEFEDIEDVDDSTDAVQEKIDELKGINEMYAWVIEDIISDSDEYDGDTLKEKIQSRCQEILEHGCANGTVGSMVYYSDTVAFFDKYADDIYDLIDNYGPDEFLQLVLSSVNTTEVILNCDTAKNKIAWLAYEEIAYELSNALEEL